MRRPGTLCCLVDVQPWICRESIAPRIWQEADRTALWVESNGSEGCYGGWELLFPVVSLPPASAAPHLASSVRRGPVSDTLLLELAAQATGLERGTDELVVEAFWYDDSGAEVNWDPVLLDRATVDDRRSLVPTLREGAAVPGRRDAARCPLRRALVAAGAGALVTAGGLQRTALRPPRTLPLGRRLGSAEQVGERGGEHHPLRRTVSPGWRGGR